jgi:hypothetical protein
MFCAALPMVACVTAAAQGEQRKKIQAAELRQQQALDRTTLVPNERTHSTRDLAPVQARPARIWLTPRRITQLGALVFVGLLFGSGFYHTHFPG